MVAVLVVGCGMRPADDLRSVADDYVAAWAAFFPSLALSAGKVDAATAFETFDQPTVDAWLEVNHRCRQRLEGLPDPIGLDDRVDRTLLLQQIAGEIHRWSDRQAHRTDPRTYSTVANHALTPILVRRNLAPADRLDAVLRRLEGLRRLADEAKANLRSGRPAATAAAVRDLRATAGFLEDGLASALELEPGAPAADRIESAAVPAAAALDDLAAWLEAELEIAAEDAWGRELLARELVLAYGDETTPEVLEGRALAEIETVRGLMEDLARSAWVGDAAAGAPEAFDELVRPLLADMEAENAGGQAAFLQEFLTLIDRSEDFLRQRDLVDLPAQRTLYTALSPSHFAGAAVGGVYPAGPFDPEAETLFYLPTVPDTAPDAVRAGFYRSFNHSFNTMIITHEIYPGHYLQLKAAASHPSRIRPLFAGDGFTEGWASFCEQMALDAGWDDDRLLTRMAHLRKRLENAVRAYVSVQVHCRGWGREALHDFAVETGLLPPQFAENLWHRAVLTPIQLPSYFIGFRAFDRTWRTQRDLLGDDFDAKVFNNAVLASGGVPLEMLDEVLSAP
jgi:uncharacterized protein (DUF885 family)